MNKTTDVAKRIDEIYWCVKDFSRRNFSCERKIEIATKAKNELVSLKNSLSHSEKMDPVLRDKISEACMICYYMASEEKPAERI